MSDAADDERLVEWLRVNGPHNATDISAGTGILGVWPGGIIAILNRLVAEGRLVALPHQGKTHQRWAVAGDDKTPVPAEARADLDTRSAGRKAFEAYAAHVGGKTHDGKPIPGWENLTDAVREGWDAAALAAIT